MAQSPEYPDLKFIEPRAWGRGRDGKAVRYIVIHYTAGSERATSAEDGARYNQTRTDGTSAHYFVDQNSVVQGVKTTDRANCARHRGNRLGIQYELCGTVQTRKQWLDAASLPTLRNAARQAARDCRKYDIPVRRLSVAETRAAWTDFPKGPKGFVGHVDCTRAYPEDEGDHTDPGGEFPWDVFLGMVRDELTPPAPPVEDSMAGITQDEFDERFIGALSNPGIARVLTRLPWQYEGGGIPTGTTALGVLSGTYAAALRAAGDDTDEQQIAALVLAGLDPAVIAASVHADDIEGVIAALRARQQS